MPTSLTRSITAIAAIVAAGLVFAACSSDNATGPSEDQVKDAASTTTQAPATTAATTTAAPTTATTTTQQAAADGKAIFAENCAGCHTLKDAGASGQVGPNLDTLKPSDTQVETKVNAGGASMPAFKGQLSPEEITAVSAYVASSAGG